MGFRFRQVLRIFPGLRLNLNKSGVSTSIGGRGATLNIGRKGVRGTAGIPGSGLSYSDMIQRSGRTRAAENRRQAEQNDRELASILPTEENEEANLYLLTIYLVVESGKASASWLGRQLQVDYKFAEELIQQMQNDGIVSSADGVGRRKVLVDINSLPPLPEEPSA